MSRPFRFKCRSTQLDAPSALRAAHKLLILPISRGIAWGASVRLNFRDADHRLVSVLVFTRDMKSGDDCRGKREGTKSDNTFRCIIIIILHGTLFAVLWFCGTCCTHSTDTRILLVSRSHTLLLARRGSGLMQYIE